MAQGEGLHQFLPDSLPSTLPLFKLFRVWSKGRQAAFRPVQNQQFLNERHYLVCTLTIAGFIIRLHDSALPRGPSKNATRLR
jgi:hypothetical protein